MGPYCRFCGRRCFTHMPAETPQHVLLAYRKSYGPGPLDYVPITIVATCAAGQRFEKERIGYCYEDILHEIEIARMVPDIVSTPEPMLDVHIEREVRR